MAQEMLSIGDIIEYSAGRRARVVKIREISTGKFIEQYSHEGKGEDIILSLDDGQGVINFWLKDKAFRKINERPE